MRKYGDAGDVRAELAGKTGLILEYEAELCDRIASLEREGGVKPSLKKRDWLFIAAMLAASAALFVCCIAWSR